MQQTKIGLWFLSYSCSKMAVFSSDMVPSGAYGFWQTHKGPLPGRSGFSMTVIWKGNPKSWELRVQRSKVSTGSQPCCGLQPRCIGRPVGRALAGWQSVCLRNQRSSWENSHYRGWGRQAGIGPARQHFLSFFLKKFWNLPLYYCVFGNIMEIWLSRIS